MQYHCRPRMLLGSVHEYEAPPMAKFLVHPNQLLYAYPISPLLLGLEIVEEDRSLLGLLAVVADHHTRTVDDLACIALTVQNACGNYQRELQALNHGSLHKPAHSPSCLPSGTLINGILCSEQRAMTSFLYASVHIG
jgi:hypothetical protein